MSEVDKYSPIDTLDIDYVNILLIGAVGAGKSSYFNTINSIFRGHVTSQACSGSADQFDHCGKPFVILLHLFVLTGLLIVNHLLFYFIYLC